MDRNIQGRDLALPVGKEHDERVDDVVIKTTQRMRDVLMML